MRYARKYCRGTATKWDRRSYEFWQLITMFLYGIVYNLTYRDLEEEFRISEVLRKALNLEEVPLLLNDMQSREEVEGGGFEEDVRREFQSVGREVRYSGNRFYRFKRRQFKLLLR